MFDLALLLILIFGFFIGLKRGLIRQLITLTGFIIAFIAAYLYHERLAPELTLWVPYPNMNTTNSTVAFVFDNANLEDAYYRAIAFVVIFFAVKIVWSMMGRMLDFIAKIPVFKQLNSMAGGILGFVEVYFIMFIILFIAALLPVESIQTTLTNSILADFIIKNTPYLSDQIQDLWLPSAPTAV